MITKLEINGFKSFLNKAIPLSNITLLCGFNNSGKSSVIQAVRMMCNSFDFNIALLPGHGGVEELRSKYVLPTEPIEFKYHFPTGTSTFQLTNTGFIKPSIAPISYYLSADRLGPQVTLPLEQRLSKFPLLGEHGEFIVSFLDALREFLIPDKLQHPKAQGTTLEYQLAGWLQEIAPGVEVIYRTDSKRDAGHFEFNTFRPANVGFGLSYCMPIIAAILGLSASAPPSTSEQDKEQKAWTDQWEHAKAERGILVMIENPEAHLHPSGQTALGRLIALGATCGIQFLIETQSDHLMDGIRIAVKQKHITPAEVKFHYLKKEASGETAIDSPDINSEGKLSHWPEGFFDQTLKNRTYLAR